jgi:moderate conductance mechanosensitive channel
MPDWMSTAVSRTSAAAIVAYLVLGSLLAPALAQRAPEGRPGDTGSQPAPAASASDGTRPAASSPSSGPTAAPDASASGPTSPGPGAGPGNGSGLEATRERLKSVTDADRIAYLRQAIADNQKRLDRLVAERDDPRGEYAQSDVEFRDADTRLIARKEALERARRAGRTREAQTIAAEVETLGRRWNLAKERFDLAIERRRAIGEEVATLQQLISGDRTRLDRLTGAAPIAADAASPSAPPAPPGAASTSPAPDAPPPASPGSAAAPGAGVPAAPMSSAPASPPTAPTAGGPRPDDASRVATERKRPPSEELIRAESEVKRRADALREAERRETSLAQRLEAIGKRIELEEKQLETARKLGDNAQATQAELEAELKAGGARLSAAQRAALVARVEEVRNRAQRVSAEVGDRAALLERLRSEQNFGREALTVLRENVAQAQRQLEAARAEVADITNPFAPRNLFAWAIEHGPRILAIAVVMLLLRWLVQLLGRRVVRVVVQRGTDGSGEEALDRANTLVGVFQNAASTAIVVGGVLMILQEAGVPVAPLLGGAAVVGLAVAFGAQNLIRDYFQGFMILLEGQFKLKDAVRINNLSGQVEMITLRMTALRDMEGNLHFIPNGEIKSVTNMSHGWSRAVFEIPIAYQDDVDRVMEEILELGQEIRRDPRYASFILDDPTMLGVDAFGENGIVIKFFMKTAPLQQWLVKREMLRRIKHRFDQMGIAIPFAQRTVYQRPAVDRPVEEPGADGDRHREGARAPDRDAEAPARTGRAP